MTCLELYRLQNICYFGSVNFGSKHKYFTKYSKTFHYLVGLNFSNFLLQITATRGPKSIFYLLKSQMFKTETFNEISLVILFRLQIIYRPFYSCLLSDLAFGTLTVCCVNQVVLMVTRCIFVRKTERSA